MNISILACFATIAALIQGMAFSQSNRPMPDAAQTSKADSSGQYDDRQVARIHRGETTERQALEWFGAPEMRQVAADGSTSLAWMWGKSGGGRLSIRFSPEGKVLAYSARSVLPEETRTLAFRADSEKEMRSNMEDWQHQGWKVLSVSKPFPQPDGTVKRKAELSRDGITKSAIAYDDEVISRIRRGETTESQLLEWFGPPVSRDLHPEGRLDLSWKLGDWHPGSGNSGQLDVLVSPEGKVASYTARRGT